MWIKEFLIIFLQLRIVFGLSAGAPNLACNDLSPQHGTNVPQTTQFPLSVDVPLGIESGSTVRIRIFSTNPGFSFRGFLIQAKPEGGEEQVIGRFIPVDATTQPLTCFNQAGSTATHTSSVLKDEVVLDWEAPVSGTPIPFNFVITVVAAFDTFWVAQRFGLNVVIPEPTTTVDPNETTTETEDPTETTTETEETDPPPGIIPTPAPPVTEVTPLVMTHGSMMIVAWIGCTSIGVVIAAYFKDVWRKRKNPNAEVWFIWHVLCMFLTWTLTLSAFIIIFIEIGEWRSSVHAILGCIVMFLATIQPLGALLRPDEKSNARPLFNWLHMAFGNITHLLAILTIFYATPLSQANLPQYTIYVVIGYVVYYVIMHIIFASINAVQKTRPKRVTTDNTKIAPVKYSMLLKTLLGFFVITITGCAIALVLIFTL